MIPSRMIKKNTPGNAASKYSVANDLTHVIQFVVKHWEWTLIYYGNLSSSK